MYKKRKKEITKGGRKERKEKRKEVIWEKVNV